MMSKKTKAKFDEDKHVDSFPHEAPWKDGYSDHAAHDVVDPDVPGDVIEVDVNSTKREAPWRSDQADFRDAAIQAREADERVEIVSERAAVLREAEDLICGDRNQSYGHPTQNFTNIAAIWNVQFAHLLKDGARFEPEHIAQAQIGVKLARMVASPKRDHYVDIAGYAGCGWEAAK